MLFINLASGAAAEAGMLYISRELSSEVAVKRLFLVKGLKLKILVSKSVYLILKFLFWLNVKEKKNVNIEIEIALF